MTPRCASVFTDTDKRAHRCERPAEHCDWDVDRYGHTLHRQGNTSWQTRAENVVETALWTPTDGYPHGTATAYPVGLGRYVGDPLAPPIPEAPPVSIRTFTVPDRLVSEFLAVHGGTTPGVVNLSRTANELANVMLDQLPEDWPEDQVTITADPLHRHQHESWMVQRDGDGPATCAACGTRVCGAIMPGTLAVCVLEPTGHAHLDAGGHRSSIGTIWSEDIPSGETVEPVQTRDPIDHLITRHILAQNGRPPLELCGVCRRPIENVRQECGGIPIGGYWQHVPYAHPIEDTPSADAQHEGDTPLEDTPTPQALDWRQMVEAGRVFRRQLEGALDRVLDPRPFGVPATWTPESRDRLDAALREPRRAGTTMPRVAGWRAAWRARR